MLWSAGAWLPLRVPTPIQTSGASRVLLVASISLLWLNTVVIGCAVQTWTSEALGAIISCFQPEPLGGKPFKPQLFPFSPVK